MLKERTAAGVHCRTCGVKKLCVARDAEDRELDEINKMIHKIYMINSGDEIYYAGQKMENLFAVYSGCCKDYFIDAEGAEYVSNFYLPGDILGLESLPNKKHLCTAKAVSHSRLCVIPIRSMLDKMTQYPRFLQRVMSIMSYKMQNDRHIRVTTNAKQRVADFLLNMLRRDQERGYQQEHILLPMSQCDIGNLLGLAYETVSRILHGLSDLKIIEINPKEIIIRNVPALKDISSSSELSHGQRDGGYY